MRFSGSKVFIFLKSTGCDFEAQIVSCVHYDSKTNDAFSRPAVTASPHRPYEPRFFHDAARTKSQPAPAQGHRLFPERPGHPSFSTAARCIGSWLGARCNSALYNNETIRFYSPVFGPSGPKRSTLGLVAPLRQSWSGHSLWGSLSQP